MGRHDKVGSSFSVAMPPKRVFALLLWVAVVCTCSSSLREATANDPKSLKSLGEEPSDGLAPDLTAEELNKKLLEAKNQVAQAKSRVAAAVNNVAKATAEAKAAKMDADQTTKDAEIAKAETEKRMAEARQEFSPNISPCQNFPRSFALIR